VPVIKESEKEGRRKEGGRKGEGRRKNGADRVKFCIGMGLFVCVCASKASARACHYG